MPILSHSDPEIKKIIKQNAMLKRSKFMDRGHFCMVFETRSSSRVLKLTADRTHHAYLVSKAAPQGPFKPQAHRDFGIVGHTGLGVAVYLLEVERLYPIERHHPHCNAINKLLRFEGRKDRLPATKQDSADFDPDMLKFMRGLNRFTKRIRAGYDLYMDNFMQRSDGHLVFSDPIFDPRLADGYTWRSGS